MNPVGRFCELNGIEEVTRLRQGMDFRLPQFRREVFLRFYEFNLTFHVQPGCVHYLLPWIASQHQLDREGKLWLNFLCMSPGNIVTGYTFFRRWPSLADFRIRKRANLGRLSAFFKKNYDNLGWDTDRRWEKNHFPELVEAYTNLMPKTQGEFYDAEYIDALTINGRSPEENRFEGLWATIRKKFPGFGRMTTYSFLERLRVLGEPLECPSLYLEERSGSKAHRNGLLKVLGRDDLDWHKSNPGFHGNYSNEQIEWLKTEGEQLLAEARKRVGRKNLALQRDATYLTLESTFCTYKSWFRPNRRYPNVYNDWMLEQIEQAERIGDDQDIFRKARAHHVPAALRAETNANDPGYSSVKQNWFLRTGQVINLNVLWPEFRNGLNDAVSAGRKPEFPTW